MYFIFVFGAENVLILSFNLCTSWLNSSSFSGLDSVYLLKVCCKFYILSLRFYIESNFSFSLSNYYRLAQFSNLGDLLWVESTLLLQSFRSLNDKEGFITADLVMAFLFAAKVPLFKSLITYGPIDGVVFFSSFSIGTRTYLSFDSSAYRELRSGELGTVSVSSPLFFIFIYLSSFLWYRWRWYLLLSGILICDMLNCDWLIWASLC